MQLLTTLPPKQAHTLDTMTSESQQTAVGIKRCLHKKVFADFVNSHHLKGVATMAELTKSDSRQPMGKIKPTDKMVMMPSLFDGMKPATSK